MSARGAAATGLSATSPRSFLAVGFPLLSLTEARDSEHVVKYRLPPR
ncbi:MAG: hypothetical protein ACKVOQ_15975 [Cyclobacteriaceae bacterium]